MEKYVLLYKDETARVSYFYNLEKQAVYLDKKTADSTVVNRMTKSGAMVALFIYPFIRNAQKWHVESPSVLCIQIMAFGLLLGWISSFIIINHCRIYFVPENKLEVTQEEVRELYITGKSYRKKCCYLLIGLLVFLIIATGVLCNLSMDIYCFWCLVLLWGIWGMILWTNRPICSYRFRKSFVSDSKSERT